GGDGADGSGGGDASADGGGGDRSLTLGAVVLAGAAAAFVWLRRLRRR
ncbi:WD40 repeat domain-containing protein, partial [Streptomyces sp. GC420]|nr:WD40 repeat domain-containing protein [Streptomyces sp. GC420]